MPALAKIAAETRLDFLERRSSVKEFGDRPLAAHVYAQLREQLARPPRPFHEKAPSLGVYAVPVRIDGLLEPRIEYANLGDAAWRPVRAVNGEAIARQWVPACQGQALLRKAACLFCVGIAERELFDNSYEVYRHAVIGAGFVIGAMYRAAVRLAVGTTTIGGFSDKAVAVLLDAADFLPIVIQAFGSSGGGVRKADAARIVLSTRG